MLLKHWFLSFFVLVAFSLGAACTSDREKVEQPPELSSLDENGEAIAGLGSVSPELSPTAVAAAATKTIEPPETPTSMPSPTATMTTAPTPTNMPVPTPTPKPLTPANFGWEGTDMESRPPFLDEQRVKDEILARYENSEITVAREDIKIAWYTAEDGTIYWRPYFTSHMSSMGSDLLLFVFEPEENKQGVVSLRKGRQSINLSYLERLGLISDLTDLQLLWSERNSKPLTAVEKNGARLWYTDEFVVTLASYDDDLSAFDLPPKPTSSSEYVLALNPMGGDKYFLFPFDEDGELTAGIARYYEGPTHELVNNTWQEINGADSIAVTPRIAYVGYDENGNSYLYVDDAFINDSSPIPMYLRNEVDTAQAVAPAPYFMAQGVAAVPATPSWSPNSRLVAFITEEDGQRFLAVYDTDTEETHLLKNIAANAAIAEHITWSPDGNRILYRLVSPNSSSGGIWSTSYPDGQDNYIGQGCSATWMEVNNEAMIIYNPNCYINEYETAYPDGSETGITVSAPDQTTHPYDDLFGYVPNKNAFLFSRSNLENKSLDLFLLPINDDKEIFLASIPNPENIDIYLNNYVFSPDGKWLVWRNADGVGKTVFNLENQTLRVEPEWYSFSGWSPDSKGYGQGVQIVDIETGERLALFTLPSGVLNVVSFRGDSGFDLGWVERAEN